MSDKIQQYKTPSHIESEDAILCCMIMEKNCLIAGLDALDSDDFFTASNRHIFIAISDLHYKNKSIDLINVNNELSSKNLLESIGGVQKLSLLSTVVHTTEGFESYIENILEKSRLRSIISMCENSIQNCLSGSNDSYKVLEHIGKSMLSIQSKFRDDEFVNLIDVIQNVVGRLELLSEENQLITGLQTHFKDFDKATAGLQPSTLVLIAGRPAMGKTSFGLNIAQNLTLDGKKVAFFSLEMSKEELATRILSSCSNVSSEKTRSGNLVEEDWQNVVDFLTPISNTNMYIDDTPGITITEIKRKARKLKDRVGLDAIFIDYLQIMSSHIRSDNRQQIISEISRELKIMAKEFSIPVVVLSQLSRSVEQRTGDKRPVLSDLRESGAIEQDADIVTFLYRDEYYNAESEYKGLAELIIAKHRAGSTGTIYLSWNGDITTFKDAINPNTYVPDM